jgi:hypothetical protein
MGVKKLWIFNHWSAHKVHCHISGRQTPGSTRGSPPTAPPLLAYNKCVWGGGGEPRVKSVGFGVLWDGGSGHQTPGSTIRYITNVDPGLNPGFDVLWDGGSGHHHRHYYKFPCAAGTPYTPSSPQLSSWAASLFRGDYMRLLAQLENLQVNFIIFWKLDTELVTGIFVEILKLKCTGNFYAKFCKQ